MANFDVKLAIETGVDANAAGGSLGEEFSAHNGVIVSLGGHLDGIAGDHKKSLPKHRNILIPKADSEACLNGTPTVEESAAECYLITVQLSNYNRWL